MGYTHYMHALKLNPELAQAAREIVDAADCLVGDGDGVGEPFITDEEIRLNGDVSQGLACETFCLADDYGEAPDWYSNFCKTARNPYDKVVGAILIYAICSGAEGYESIGSDGTLEEREWHEAVDLYEKCFGRLGEEEFTVVLEQIGRPRVYNEEAQAWEDWDGEMTRKNYEEICAQFDRGY